MAGKEMETKVKSLFFFFGFVLLFHFSYSL